MTNYVGLDVSQKTTTLCIVDGEGHRQWRGECVTSPERIVQAVLQHAGAEVSIGIETAFLHQQNPFARRNVTAIVLEVPSEVIGKGKINAWATISLFGHAPEVQVSRWGLPMVTHLFLNDPSDQEVKEQFNASAASEDLERFAKSIANVAEKMTTYAGSATNPAEYGKQIAERLCPDILPYEPGTPAAFEVDRFNGRALGDDALDVMLTLTANTPIADGLAPDRGRMRKDFPYYGAPYTAEEQAGMTPLARPAKKSAGSDA